MNNDDLPSPGADVNDASDEYLNMSSSFEYNPQTTAIGNKGENEDVLTDSSTSVSNSFEANVYKENPNSSNTEESSLPPGSIDQRIDRLERLTFTVFDAIRQLSQQVYSVDSKLAFLMDNGILNQGVAESVTSGETDNQNGVECHQQCNTNVVTSRRLSWEERFKELKRYRKDTGHCDVPQTYSSGLGTWVSAQRSQHKRFSVGKTSSMTKQRKEALEELGFSWSLRKRFSWDERFIELRGFSRDNDGSCEVPNDGIYKSLWAWCQNQKHGYKKSIGNKGPVIPAERVAMMERIGFCWDDDTSMKDRKEEDMVIGA